MSKLPTAKEFLIKNADRFQSLSPDVWLVEFAKMHLEEAQSNIAENACVSLDVYSMKEGKLLGGKLEKEPTYPPSTSDHNFYVKAKINKASVIKSYPITNIK